jgi:thiol-disulfide isomerase/thioredoxin
VTCCRAAPWCPGPEVTASGMPRAVRRALTVGAAAASIALVAACSSTSQEGSGTSYVAGDGTVTLVPADRRGAPVAVSGSTLEGTPIDVGTMRGKPVVLNVWGSWCPPCRKEAPGLEAAYATLKDRGVSFVGINTREDDVAQALAFQKTFRVTYPSVVDDGGRVLLSLHGAVAPSAIPTTLVLDQRGRIAARVSGAVDTTTLVGLVDDVLKAG